jgi:Phospholipase_D-nuclease N-terminal
MWGIRLLAGYWNSLDLLWTLARQPTFPLSESLGDLHRIAIVFWDGTFVCGCIFKRPSAGTLVRKYVLSLDRGTRHLHSHSDVSFQLYEVGEFNVVVVRGARFRPERRDLLLAGDYVSGEPARLFMKRESMNQFLQRTRISRYVLAAILALGASFAWFAALLAGSIFISTWLDQISVESALFAAICALLVPAPVVSLFLLFVWLPLEVSNFLWPEYQFAFVRSLSVTVPVFAVVCLAAIVVAVRCFLHHRRFSERGTIAWTIFVFCFGLPGFIGYLLHRRWPVLVRCTHCSQETPRDRDACLKCNTPFPPPSMKGIEVFA